MKRLLLLIVLFIPLCSSAQDSLDMAVIKADLAYKEGRFNEAIQLYQSVIDKQYASAGLYYNLGNSCFKTGDMASAILYYERSLKLRPGDENTIFNLKVAQTKTIDRIDEVPEPVYKRAWRKAMALFPADQWGWIIISSLTLMLLFVALFLLATNTRVRKLAFWMGAFFLLIFVVSNILGYQQYEHQRGSTEAIVFVPALHVKSSPDEGSNDVFVIHEGTKLSIRDQIGEWCEIRIANGNVGWVKASTLKII